MSLYTQWVFYVVILAVLIADIVFVLRRVLPVYDATIKARHIIGRLQATESESEAYTRAWSTLNKARFYNLESYTHQIVTLLVAFSLSVWAWATQATPQMVIFAAVPWATLGFICWARWFLERQYEQVSEMYLKGLLKRDNPFEYEDYHSSSKVTNNARFARVSYKSPT